MRTTIDIDPHLLKKLRAEAHRQGISLKNMLDKVIHRGLSGRAPAKGTPYRCPSFAMGATNAGSLDRALAIASGLEDDETARELSLRK